MLGDCYLLCCKLLKCNLSSTPPPGVTYLCESVPYMSIANTFQVDMESGGSRLYLSWHVRNPSQALNDIQQAIDPSMRNGATIQVPWDPGLYDNVTEADLYGALFGEGVAQSNNYTLQYQHGVISGSGRSLPMSCLVVLLAMLGTLTQ